MSEYFNYSALSRGTLARASDVNARFQAVETGLALLPARAKLHEDRVGYHAPTGTANALVVTMSPPLTAYAEGLKLRLKIAATNSGAATLNVNGLGAIAIKRHNGEAVAAAIWLAGRLSS